MGGHNNQPKVGLSNGIKLGGTSRRTITMGEDAVALFWPSNLGAKNKIKQNLLWLKAAANQRLNTTTNQIHAGVVGEVYERTCNWWGVQGERYFIVLGAIKFR